MNASVAAVSGPPPVARAWFAAAANRPSPEDVFKRLDSAGKGYLSLADFSSAIVTISPEGARQSLNDGAPNPERVAKVFARLDANGDGQVTQDEFVKAAANDHPRATPAIPAAGHHDDGDGDVDGAGPDHDGPRRATRAEPASAGTAAGSTDTTSYSPEDTNHDGTVSTAERQAYIASLIQQATHSVVTDAAHVSVSTAISAYLAARAEQS